MEIGITGLNLQLNVIALAPPLSMLGELFHLSRPEHGNGANGERPIYPSKMQPL